MIVSCTFDHITDQPDVVRVTSTNAQPYVPRYTYYFPWCIRSPTHIPDYFVWRSNLILQWCDALEVSFIFMTSIEYRVDELSPLICIVKKIKSTLQFIGSQINTRAWRMLNLNNILFMMESGIVALNKIKNAVLSLYTISLAYCCFYELCEAYFLQQILNSTVKIIHDLNYYNCRYTTERFN
ncbi:hypothetical protein THOM_1253 [Trachipleistophora hominis]|uniref:Uncharacterized protein n=1 Tax=Trachipleistophora hominis TaxID=72359 RepID=L7JYH9_TRAHO|nr:hypothetical protein THOM_1253 [Trachipleistophora hominis]